MADELDDVVGVPSLPDDFLSGIKPTVGKVVTQPPVEEDKDKDEDKSSDELADDLEDKDKDKDKPNTQGKDKDKDKDKSEDDASIVSFYKQELGEVEGEFDDSLDGSIGYIKKIIEKKQEEAKQEGQEELLSIPEIKALKEHLDAGFKIDSFLRQKEMYDFKSIDLDKDGEDTDILAERLYREARRVKGDDPDEIEEAVSTAKDNGKIRERGKAGLKYLDKLQEEEILSMQAKEKQQTDKIKADQKKMLDDAEAVLKSGKLLGVAVDKKELDALREYSFKEDKQGLTQRDKDINNLTIEEHLFLDRIIKNKFKGLGVEVKQTKPDDNTYKKLKEELAKKKTVNLDGGSGGIGKSRPDPATMFLNN